MTSLHQTVLHTFSCFCWNHSLSALNQLHQSYCCFNFFGWWFWKLSFQFLNGFFISLWNCKSFFVTGAILIVSVASCLSLYLLVYGRLYSLAAVSSSPFIEGLSLLKQWYLFTFLHHEFWILLPELSTFIRSADVFLMTAKS